MVDDEILSLFCVLVNLANYADKFFWGRRVAILIE